MKTTVDSLIKLYEGFKSDLTLIYVIWGVLTVKIFVIIFLYDFADYKAFNLNTFLSVLGRIEDRTSEIDNITGALWFATLIGIIKDQSNKHRVRKILKRLVYREKEFLYKFIDYDRWGGYYDEMHGEGIGEINKTTQYPINNLLVNNIIFESYEDDDHIYYLIKKYPLKYIKSHRDKFVIGNKPRIQDNSP